MKIKLLHDVPVEDKHGMKKGREFDTVQPDDPEDTSVWVMGDAGEKVKLLRREYKTIG